MPDSSRPPNRRRVAVVYHFFAHYRAPVMRELLKSDRFDFLMFGDTKVCLRGRGSGIKLWDDCPPDRFVRTRTFHLAGPFILQGGLLRLALRRDVDDVIYLGNAFWVNTWISALAARLAGKRVFFWSIGWMGYDRGFKRLVRNMFYRIANALMLYGHLAKMVAIDNGFDPDLVHVIYNSLDYDAQKAARARLTPQALHARRAELFPGSERPMIICTTRLQAHRRLDELLKAMRILKNEGYPVDLLLVGDGPERETLETMANDLEVSVNFFGACYDEAVLSELIASSNVTIAPGMVGLTAIQSLAYGTPVITHDSAHDQAPEWEAIVPGRTGDVFRRHDIEGLARVIRRWTPERDPDESIRSACIEIIERFYNPQFQRRVIERCLDGEPADDLFWMTEETVGS